MTEYEQQAVDFLTETGTTLTIEYQYTGPYFPDDKETRDIYRFTLKNAKGEYSALFGDSIRNTQRRAFALDPGSLWPDATPHARKLGLKTRGDILAARKHRPGAYDVLACLNGYEPGTFVDFCANYGYDEDSYKAMDVYLSVQKEWDGLQRIFSRVELEKLAEIN